jgi:hypothetical protein
VDEAWAYPYRPGKDEFVSLVHLYLNGRQYFERVMSEMERDRKQKRTRHLDEIGQNARDRWDYAQIKVSMAGKSSGSKFTNHHAGN